MGLIEAGVRFIENLPGQTVDLQMTAYHRKSLIIATHTGQDERASCYMIV